MESLTLDQNDFELSEQEKRELENPAIACAVDALLDFMEACPETWGRKPKGSIVPLIPRHYDSDWLAEYLKPFLSVPFFVEGPEIRAWLLKAGIFEANKGNSKSGTSFSLDALAKYDEGRLGEDLESLRKSTQDEVLARVKQERPDMVEKIETMMRGEELQFSKTAPMRDLVFKRCILWMKKNKKWISESPDFLFSLPETLSAACAVYIEIEYHELLEELKMRQLIEIAPLEPEDTDEGYSDEIVWHLDHLDLRKREFFGRASFSFGRLLILFISIGILLSSMIQVGEMFGWLKDPNTHYRQH